MSESHYARTQRDGLIIISTVNPHDLGSVVAGWEQLAQRADELRTQVQERLDVLIGNDGWEGTGAEAFRAALVGRIAEPLERSAQGTTGLATELTPLVDRVRSATATAEVSAIPWDGAPWSVRQKKLLPGDFEVRKPDESGVPQVDATASRNALDSAQANAPYEVRDGSGRVVKTVPVDEWRAISSQPTPMPPQIVGEVSAPVHRVDVVFEDLDLNTGVRARVAAAATGVESAFTTLLSAPSVATDPTYEGPNLPGQDGTLPPGTEPGQRSTGTPSVATPGSGSGSTGPGASGPGAGSTVGQPGGSGSVSGGSGAGGSGSGASGAGGSGSGGSGGGGGAGVGGSGVGSAAVGGGNGWWTSGTSAAGVDGHGQFGVPLGGGATDTVATSSAGAGFGSLAGGALMSGAGLLGGRNLAAMSGVGGMSATSGVFGTTASGAAGTNPSFSMGSTGRGTVSPGNVGSVQFAEGGRGSSGAGGASGSSGSSGSGTSAVQGGPVPVGGRRSRDDADEDSDELEGTWLEEDVDVWGIKDVRGEGLTRY